MSAYERPEGRIGAWRTDSLTVNGVEVRLVVQHDADGNEFVVVDCLFGTLAGEEPGLYYPQPLDRLTFKDEDEDEDGTPVGPVFGWRANDVACDWGWLTLRQARNLADSLGVPLART